MSDHQILRQKICEARAKLPADFQQRAAAKVADIVAATTIFQASTHIAIYLAVNGELNPLPLMQQAWEQGKHCYVPILSKKKPLQFVSYNAGDSLHNNYFGIPEPELSTAKLMRPEDLDLVITPLVGFDVDGNRLGMGGGYYDKTFDFTKQQEHHKPCLLGAAYEFQNISQMTTESWDVPLDMVATEVELRDFTGINSRLS